MRARPAYFICHDSRDKESVATPLAIELGKQLGAIWYDDFSIRPGDSLRESIENGIKQCRRGILVISKNFLSNSGWTRNEFNALFQKEIIEKKHVFIPIWHGVTSREVYEYSPILADRKAFQTTDGIPQIVESLVELAKGGRFVGGSRTQATDGDGDNDSEA